MRLLTSLLLSVCTMLLSSPAAGVLHDGFEQDAEERVKHYAECIANSKRTPVRGEYESKGEFEKRKRSLSVSCGSRTLESAVMKIGLRLNYDADREEFKFTFNIDGGRHKMHSSMVHERCKTANEPASLVLETHDRNEEGRQNFVIANHRYERRFSDPHGAWRNVEQLMSNKLECLDQRGSGFDREFFSSVFYTYRPRVYAPYMRGKWVVKKRFRVLKREFTRIRGKPSFVGRGEKITAIVSSPVARARQLKSMEESLRILYHGTFTIKSYRIYVGYSDRWTYNFEVRRVEMVDQETGKILLHFGGE